MASIAPAPEEPPFEFARHIVAVLHALGIRAAYGVIGREIVPLVSALHAAPLVVRYARSESGAALMALGDWTQSDRPTALFVTTGPGITNVLTGAGALRAAGAPFVLLSPLTPAEETDRGAIQETGGDGYLAPREPFDYQAQIHSAAQLEIVAGRLAAGLASTPGFAAHLQIPQTIQAMLTGGDAPAVPVHSVLPGRPDVAPIASLLRGRRVALWVGSGARDCGPQVRELVARTGMPVCASPRGLGVADACDSFVGVVGNGGHKTALEELAAFAPEYMLVLGTTRGQASSGWEPALIPSQAFVVVDRDPRAFAGGYPQVTTIGVQSALAPFLDALLEADLPRMTFTRRRAPRARLAVVEEPTPGVVHPGAAMASIQRVIVERSDAPIFSDASSPMFWCAHCLEFHEGGRYFTEHAWGSIGTAGAAAVGAAAARGDVAVAVTGDAGVQMFNEINTAVQYAIPAAFVVLDDGGWGAVAHGMEANDRPDHHAWFPPTDLAQLATAMGAQAVRVTDAHDLDDALRRALAAGGPFLVDVVIDRSIDPPMGNRTQR